MWHRILLAVLIFLSENSVASKCIAHLELLNISNEKQEIEICLEFNESKLNECAFPDTYVVPPRQTKAISLGFMCGYASDPKLDDYWVLFKTSSLGKYKSQKYAPVLKIL